MPFLLKHQSLASYSLTKPLTQGLRDASATQYCTTTEQSLGETLSPTYVLPGSESEMELGGQSIEPELCECLCIVKGQGKHQFV